MLLIFALKLTTQVNKSAFLVFVDKPLHVICGQASIRWEDDDDGRMKKRSEKGERGRKAYRSSTTTANQRARTHNKIVQQNRLHAANTWATRMGVSHSRIASRVPG